MSLHDAVEGVMQSITDLNDDWYELSELSDEAVISEDEVELPMSTCNGETGESSLAHKKKGVSERQLQKSRENHVVEIVRSFIRHVYYSHSLLLKSAGLTCGSICPWDLDPITIKKELRGIMSQCRRIRDDPHMFPSALLKDKFLTTMAILADAMISIEETRSKILEVKQQAYSPVTNMYQPFSSEFSSQPVVCPMPAYLPDKLYGKHPWNNWLDNSAESATGWVAIQQKIPKVGEKLMRKIVLLYDVMQERFEQEDDSGLPHEKNDEIPAPGDSFRHMTWSGFCTVPSYNLGFKSGKRKNFDLDGIKTLEYFSKMLCKQYKGRGVELGTDNCPFFRFAMAYTKL